MKCKNIECINDTIGKRIYCSLTCRNIFVNKYIRNYDKLSDSYRKKRNKKESEYYLNAKPCKECGIDLLYSKRQYDFCNRSCAATYQNKNITEETRNKISNSIKKFINENGLFGSLKSSDRKIKIDGVSYYKLNCKFCKRDFNCLYDNIFCSNDCLSKHKRKNMNEYNIYKSSTIFKFNLSDYNSEFDFTLIEKYGWYSPTNKNNNLDGVSRDHMLSVREGYEYGIDPLLIAHPANCRLMKHTDNISKNKKSIITFEELLERIKEFEQKYGEYYKNK